MMSSKDKLVEFFTAIWGKEECYVYLATLDSTLAIKYSFHRWPTNSAQIITFVLSKNISHEVYFSPATYKEPTRATKANVDKSRVIWVEDYDSTAAHELAEPTHRIQTSEPDRQHAYWALEEPISDIELLENINRTLAYTLEGDPSGWDATQLLRPPYTVNHGFAKPWRKGKTYEVTWEESSDRSYPVTSFATTEGFTSNIESILSNTDIPDIREVLAKGNWSESFWNNFTKVPDNKKRSDAEMLIAYQAAEAGMTDAQIFAVVLDADDRWEKYKYRKDRFKRIADIVERARGKVPYSGIETIAPVTLATAGNSDNRIFFGLADFLSTNVSINWIYEKWIAEDSLGLIVGDPGVGKTQLSIRAALAMATGRVFLGVESFTQQPIKVLLFSLEMSHPPLLELFRAMNISKSDLALLNEYFIVAPLGEDLPLLTKPGRDFLEAAIDEHKPKMILFDSLSKITHKSLSDDDSTRELNRYLKRVRNEYSTAMCAVHHNRKSDKRSGPSDSLDDTYGSRFLTSETDWVLNMTPLGADAIKLTMPKNRMGPTAPPVPLFRTPDLDFILGDDNDLRELAAGKNSVSAGGLFDSLYRSDSS